MRNPLDLNISNSVFKFSVEKISKLDVLKQWYQTWLDEKNERLNSDASAFLDYTLSNLKAELNVKNENNWQNVPKKGPLIFVANHPLGGLEGMLLSQMILQHRPDLKVLTNEMLLIFPEFKDLFIGVDVLNPEKKKENAKGLLKLNKHLSLGGAVLLFPAGTVSTMKLNDFSIIDKPWKDIVGRLMIKHKASCMPIYVNERNKYSFYLSGYLHKRLRTLLLIRAMISKKHCQLDVRLAPMVEYDDVSMLLNSHELTSYLRFCCESLQASDSPLNSKSRLISQTRADVCSDSLVKQHQLLDKYILNQHNSMKVYCAPYQELGCIMEQISICREHTFRAVDEGTGKELDSDIYDPYYWHLWVFDEANKKIVGGYRLAKVKALVAEHGINKLYSYSLYHYDKGFINSLSHSVEVGRSFITEQYQRHPRALDLLWKGIGAFMVKNPDYHSIFGCVSISSQYSVLARAFLADVFVQHHAVDESQASGVVPRTRLSLPKKYWSAESLSCFSKLEVINKLLAYIDEGKTIPVLIRHYLALNGKFISFSVNTGFNNSLDGLISVDLRKTPEKYLKRYLGEQGRYEFIKKWGYLDDAA